MWADIAMADRDVKIAENLRRGNVESRFLDVSWDAWEAVVALYHAGRQDKAFRVFEDKLHRNLGNDLADAALRKGEKMTNEIMFMLSIYQLERVQMYRGEDGREYYLVDIEGVYDFLRFALDKYLQDEGKVWQAWCLYRSRLPSPDNEKWLWNLLPEEKQREVIMKVISLKDSYYRPCDNEELKISRADEVQGIILALDAYADLRRKDPEIEETILSYAREHDRYDCVLIALKHFERLEEALALTKEAPAHILFPLSHEPEKETERCRQEIQFKLNRPGRSETTIERTQTIEELEQMYALGEITKAEYEAMKTGLEKKRGIGEKDCV